MPWLGQDKTYQGAITSAETALADDERDDASVEAFADAKKAIVLPPNGSVSIEFRIRTDGSDGDSNVLELYAACGVDHYTRLVTLTCIQGTQNWSGGHFNDEITESNLAWPSSSREVIQPTTPDNHIAKYIINANGYDRFVFFLSTKDINTTTVYVDWRLC